MTGVLKLMGRHGGIGIVTRLSVITPTLVRPSLVNACRSLDTQSVEWEHLVQIDLPVLNDSQQGILSQITKSRPRQIRLCGEAHRNYGNTCRHNAIKQATGDYLVFLDDDDVLVDASVLAKLLSVINGRWAVAPVLRNGELWNRLPYANGMLVVSRSAALQVPYPTSANYTDDTKWALDLKSRFGPPQRIDFPIVRMVGVGMGGGTAQISQQDFRRDAAILEEAERMSAAEYKKRLKTDPSFMMNIENAEARSI